MYRNVLCALAFAWTASAAAESISIDIDLTEQKAYVLQNGLAVYAAPISSGRNAFPTPAGTYTVLEKDIDHRSSQYGKIVDAEGRTVVADADSTMLVPRGGRFIQAPMKFFMRFNGGYGMHAGYLPGFPASHGCVRMPRDKAELFYQLVSVGTPVRVYGKAPLVYAAPIVAEVQPKRTERKRRGLFSFMRKKDDNRRRSPRPAQPWGTAYLIPAR
jgi:L,D-transpeptidase catalytic domain